MLCGNAITSYWNTTGVTTSMCNYEQEASSQSCHVVTKFDARDHTFILPRHDVEKKIYCGHVLEDLVEWLQIQSRHDAFSIFA